jgi:hypothetical protein
MDGKLYTNPSYVTNEEVNLLNDTAYYFITYDNGVHQRMQVVANNIPLPAPAAAPYCWYSMSANGNPRAGWNPGKSYMGSQAYFFSGEFDISEGYGYFRAGGNNALQIPTPDPYVPGPAATFSFTWSENSNQVNGGNPGNLKLVLEGTSLLDTLLYNPFTFIKRDFSVPVSAMSNSVSVVFVNDNFVNTVHKATLKYPKGFSFSGSDMASFQLPANERYIEIVLNNSIAPKLYDRTNNKIYTAVVSGNISKFYLDPSATLRNITVVNPSAVNSVNGFSGVAFRDYTNAANQGDYIILTHKDFINATPNYINDFKSYRASGAGGSHTPVVVDVAELYDQFGYGYDFHALGIRDFIAYANHTWTTKPKFLFIVGKGVSYTNYTAYKQAAPGTYNYPVVPTWGEPGSDNLFSCFNNGQKPILATGRLSAWNNQEIGDYLKKVKDYEFEIRPLAIPTVEHEFWKKTVLHIAGSSDIGLQTTLLGTLNECKLIIEDTLIGALVTTVKKNSTDPVDPGSNPVIDTFMDKGVRNVSFYGHGSSSGFDYNLNSPDNYNSSPRFPVFYSFACEVAHIFGLSTAKTISERYVASINGGSIVMVAGDNTGWTGWLPDYMTNAYRSWAYRDYGLPLGEQYKNAIAFIQDLPGSASNVVMDIHTQCMLYQGDPALQVYNPEKVDFAVEEPGLSSIPTNVTTALDSFTIRAIVYSLGKSTRDSVWIRLQHTLQGSNTILYADSVKVPNLISTDTILFKVPLNAGTDIGLNNYTVKVDVGEAFDELSEANNQATLQIFIYSENLEPIYPKEYAIVHQQNVMLKASTLNAFAPVRRYKLEIDTTQLFNGAGKQSTEIISGGGVIKWTPTINYKDSVVYYWRAAPDTIINGKYNWANSSFIYLANGSDGWNQSHYFQYKEDAPFYGLNLPPNTRHFKYDSIANVLKVEDKVIDLNLGNFQDVRQSINDIVFDNGGCEYAGSVQFVVIDSTTGEPWKNGNIVGLYGSIGSCHPLNPPKKMFEYSTADSASRNKARLFLENIVPNGNYILIKNLIMHQYFNQKTINDWKADTAVYGTGNSLYHAIKNLGFDMIDQFTSERVFAFFRRKGDASYPIRQYISNGTSDKIEFQSEFYSFSDTGSVTSTVIGPVLEWQTVRWKNSSLDNAGQNDSAYMVVYGIDNANQETQLFSTLDKDISLSSVNASYYPHLKLKWYSVDNITKTSPQLDYWRVLYKPVPEAALNAAAAFSFTDSLSEGQKGHLRVAIENVTPIPMDSMLVSLKIIDANSVKHSLSEKRFKKLTGNDTLIADFDLDISAYHGAGFIYIEANPNKDQPEQYHPNNIGYLPIFNQADNLNPVLDVTFDGVHILDKDIVSAKPMIKVLLRDENKFLALNDTALMRVQLMYPGQSVAVDVPMDGTICKFIPAQMVNGHKNEARVEFKPSLIEDGVYRLIVTGKDRVGNIAGNTSMKYEVNFTVENKPSITNVLNYPNPFSTSTQFVFTMTGSEIPSQFKIQILSVTGKVVREIKKAELGNLHIGRNMTDYRWDGRDEYGQMLGNGVYLYRVVTSIRGESIEQRKNTTVDKYFKNGYGKLYIMR